MTRVSPPDDAREFPAPHASIRVTRIPARRSASAVHPPNAPAPTTTTWSAEPRTDVTPGSCIAGIPSQPAAGAVTTAPTNARRDRPSAIDSALECEGDAERARLVRQVADTCACPPLPVER